MRNELSDSTVASTVSIIAKIPDSGSAASGPCGPEPALEFGFIDEVVAADALDSHCRGLAGILPQLP